MAKNQQINWYSLLNDNERKEFNLRNNLEKRCQINISTEKYYFDIYYFYETTPQVVVDGL